MSQGFKTIFGNYWKAYFRNWRQAIGISAFALWTGLLMITRNYEIGQIGFFLFFPLIPFTFVFPAHDMLYEIIQERSSGTKGYLKLNGLGTYAHQFYWLVILSIRLFVYIMAIVIPYAIGSTVTPRGKGFLTFYFNVDPLELAQLYVLGALATAPFILCMSLMFSNPKMGCRIGTAIQIVISVIFYIINVGPGKDVKWSFPIFPQTAFLMGILKLGKWEPESAGPAKLILIAQIFLYFALYSYLDQTVHGIRKQRKKPQEGVYAQLINQESVAEESSAVFNEKLKEEAPKKVIQVNRLTRKMKKEEEVAVDDISFSVTEGEIFCLLGDEKAGKSAIFKMVTGMADFDSGEITYYGEDLKENLEEIHKKIGVCLQNDIYFEKLTLRENLELIAEIRNIPFFEIPESVDQAISSVNLGPESRIYPEDLLFKEQRRKLGIAMAMVGPQKIIFLDEPLAELDTQIRRAMWKYFVELKEKGFTVFFTTNNLEEAGELADRVALISKGKLLAMGTPEYLNKEFAVGHRLCITPVYAKFDAKQRSEIENTVRGVMPSARLVEEEGEGTSGLMKFILPFGVQEDFRMLRGQLEKTGDLEASFVANTLQELNMMVGKKLEKRGPEIILDK